MQNLSQISAFLSTAETLSFVRAGQALGLSPSAIGKSVARLEARLGARLFNRTTRRVSLTDEGGLFYERCRRIMDDLADAEASLSHALEAPRGTLRVSAPTIFYRVLSPLLPEFRRLYPEVALD